MTKLHSLVQAFVAPPAKAGMTNDLSFGGAGQFDQRALQRELARVSQGREVAFWLCFVALLIVFALSIMFLAQHSGDPAAIQKMSAATGLTILGVIGLMTKLWQDKVKADLVGAMVSGMS